MTLLFITSHSSNNQAVFDLTTKNHSDYCARHGYTYAPVTEPYNPRFDAEKVKGLLSGCDVVACFGCDVVIQHPEIPLDRYLHPGLTIGRELTGTLNADLTLFTKDACGLIDEIADMSSRLPDSQQAINLLYKHRKMITVEPMIQIAAKEMNPTLDYSHVCYEDFFAVHYHSIGNKPVVCDKAKALSASTILKRG